MFISPYDTTPLKSFQMDLIRQEIIEGFIDGSRFPDFVDIETEGMDDEVRVFAYFKENTQAKPFSHPLVFLEKEVDAIDRDSVVFDARGIAKINDRDEVVTTTDYEYAKLRSQLIASAWIHYNQKDLLLTGDLGGKVFSLLMAENLGRRMNLSDDQQRQLQACAAYYYLHLFEERGGDTDGEYLEDEETALQFARRIHRMTGVEPKEVFDLIFHQVAPYTLNEFVHFVQATIGSVRLEKLSVGVIYNLLGGIWFGPNATEHVAVGLEHPPTFLAMLYMAVTHKGYRKTILAKVADRIDRRGDLQDTFTKNIDRLF